MAEDKRPIGTTPLGDALAAFQERLGKGEAHASVSLDGLDAEELARVVLLQDCLVRLEEARAEAGGDSHIERTPGSTLNAPHGSTIPSVRGYDEESQSACNPRASPRLLTP